MRTTLLPSGSSIDVEVVPKPEANSDPDSRGAQQYRHDVNRRLIPYFLLVSVAMMAMGGIFALLGELRDELGFSETGLGVAVAMGVLLGVRRTDRPGAIC